MLLSASIFILFFLSINKSFTSAQKKSLNPFAVAFGVSVSCWFFHGTNYTRLK